MSFFDAVKQAGQSIVDSGAKTMLKTDIAFLDREIKTRKQSFGVDVYDLMEQLEASDDLSVAEKENKIRSAFDCARKDIAVVQAKIDCKQDEINSLQQQSSAAAPNTTTTTAAMEENNSSSNYVVHTGHPSDN